MTTIRVRIRPSTVANRRGSIVYVVTKNGTSRMITTHHKLFPHEWDEKTAMVVASGDNRLRVIASNILADRECLVRVIRSFDDKQQQYTAAEVVAAFQHANNDNSFFRFMESVICRLRQLNHRTTERNYAVALSRLRLFRHNEDIPFSAFTRTLMEDYEAHLRQEGLSPNSITFYMKILRAVYNRAIAQNLADDKKPFRTVHTGIEKTRKRAISLGDLKRIRSLDLSLFPARAFARDVFMFLFFCRGMSFVDAAFLKKTDIKGGVFVYRRHKTNQPLYIKVEQEMMDIVDRYSRRGSPYLLPLLDEDGDTSKQYAAAIHRINSALKKVGEMLQLNMPLTTYVSRHTWATIAKRKNVPLSVISAALGHDNEATTQIYLASIDSSVIDRANSLIIKGV